ncbi:MAG: carboxymuconolactone decarboxylase family protein [Candidatus Limnocylindria bacterium]
MTEDRLARGRATREKVMGVGVAPGTPATGELAPFFSEWVYASVFGDVWSRPGLELRLRVLITMVTLSVQGHGSQLRGYIATALKHGWTKEEIVEALVHLAPYQGVPLTHDALAIAKEVFDKEKA